MQLCCLPLLERMTESTRAGNGGTASTELLARLQGMLVRAQKQPRRRAEMSAQLHRRRADGPTAHSATGEHSAESARGSAMVGKWGGLPRIAGTVPTMSLRMRGQDMPRYTKLPCVSRPRRPARPDIWMYSPEER